MDPKDFDNLVIGAKLELTRDQFFRVFANRHLKKIVYYPAGPLGGKRLPGWRDLTLTKGTTLYVIGEDPDWKSKIVAFDTSTASRQPIRHSPEDYDNLIYTELTREDAPYLREII